MASPKTPKRNCLSLSQKVEAIKLHEKGKSCSAIAKDFGCGPTQIKSAVKRKSEVLEEYNGNSPSCRKRLKLKKTGNEEINELTWKWFCDCSSRNIKVTGPMLREKALGFAKELGIETFKGSNGWQHSFQQRHNIHGTHMSGKDVFSFSILQSYQFQLQHYFKQFLNI